MEYKFRMLSFEQKFDKMMLSNWGSLSAKNGLRDFKAADNVLTHELGDVFVLDASVCFSFYPFTEVICGDEQEFLMGSCGW